MDAHDFRSLLGLSSMSEQDAPPGTPAELVARINAEWVEALRHPDTVKRLGDITADLVANSPVEAAAFIAQERERWGKVIRTANIRAE